MKQNLHKLMAMFIASIFAVSAWAQTDVTSQYLKNAGFDDESSWVVEGNVANNNAKEVANWTATTSGADWFYSAAFGYGSVATINNVSAPATNPEGVAEGGALAISVGWGCAVQYTQDVVLPAGVYTFSYINSTTKCNDSIVLLVQANQSGITYEYYYIDETLCQGMVYDYYGDLYTETGEYRDTICYGNICEIEVLTLVFTEPEIRRDTLSLKSTQLP